VVVDHVLSQLAEHAADGQVATHDVRQRMCLREVDRMHQVVADALSVAEVQDPRCLDVDEVAVLDEAGGLERQVTLHPLDDDRQERVLLRRHEDRREDGGVVYVVYVGRLHAHGVQCRVHRRA
jgi:hypothetical protein